MADFMTSFIADFYAAAGAPAQPVDASAPDDSSQRATLASAITAGDPITISAAARAVVTRDLVQIGQQVAVLRERLWHYRLLTSAISYLPGVEPIPSEIVNAIRRTDEQEVPYAAHPAAQAVLRSYLEALEVSSTATLT